MNTLDKAIKACDKRGRIEYEDDLVIVKKNGKVIYKGLEDYEPMNREDWRYDESKGKYILYGHSEYTKELA